MGAVLGARAAKRFVLADAQHVIAVEHGFRSWAAVEEESMNINRRGVVFVQVVEGRDLAKPAGQVARASLAVYTALLEVDE